MPIPSSGVARGSGRGCKQDIIKERGGGGWGGGGGGGGGGTPLPAAV